MEVRVTVQKMPRSAHDLSWDEAERWMIELGVTNDGKADWPKLLKAAGVGTHKDTVKNRWSNGKAPRDRQNIRAELERLEKARRTPSSFGAAMMRLDEWAELGVRMARMPDVFHDVLDRLRSVVAFVEKRDVLAEQQAEASRHLDDALAAFRSVTPAPPAPDAAESKTKRRSSDREQPRGK